MPLELTALRPTTRACQGLVTAPHALAAQAGLTTLQAGGNAADAAITVASTLSVLYPHMTGIGGDSFFLYYQASSRQVVAYNGSGAAARLATRQYYSDRDLNAIPERGPLAALTAPGAVDAWFALHARFGSLEMERLLQPAIAYAEAGAPIARSLADSLALHAPTLAQDEGASLVYGGLPLRRAGELLRQPQLARTLRAIANEGRDWFYRGAGAHQIATYSERMGGTLRREDLAEHAGFFSEPLRATFSSYESVTTPPNSQGIALLIAQQVLEAYGGSQLPADGSAALVHASVEAIKLAFADRDKHVADPHVGTGWQKIVSREHAKKLAARITPFTAHDPAAELDAGDTAYFAAADRDGNAVSYIQSLFHSFGSGIVVPELGVALNNRGSAFSLSEGSLRELVPQRRPFHTLMPCMLLESGRPWLLYGSMGGEGQPQTALALSTRIAHFGMEPQAAIEAPRWRWGRTWLDEPASVYIEARFSPACIAGLRVRGHRVEVVGDWEESMGHAGALVVGKDGVLSGGADPRGDGAALGF